MDAPVIVSRDGHVATLTLNRPDKRNAMTDDMTEAFPAAVAEVAAMDDVRAVVVTGAGSAFCAGGALDFLQAGDQTVLELREKMTGFYPRYLTLLDLDVPVVAAINGAAIGAGLCLALMCDIRVAAEDASLGMTFARIGLHPGMQATALVSRAVGHAWASELFYTGRTLDGTEAAAIGLVNRAVPKDQVVDVARDIAGQVAANAPLAVRFLKQGLRQLFAEVHVRSAAWEGFAQPVTMATDDLQEGLLALRERRPPQFRGR